MALTYADAIRAHAAAVARFASLESTDTDRLDGAAYAAHITMRIETLEEIESLESMLDGLV